MTHLGLQIGTQNHPRLACSCRVSPTWSAYAVPMTSDEEKDPPVPADVEGKMPRKVHDTADKEASKAAKDKPRGS
ncbi:hypothetical protein SAMN02799638_02173 [Arthrobacter sp. UNCCL28]|nr:hypothetical protein SAMN02799638_02173 [Arthrobacter sp. UNCCL28]